LSRRRKPEKPTQEPAKSPATAQAGPADLPAAPPDRPGPRLTGLLVVLLLGAHYALAVDSLRRENPTVDEVAHLPAGVSYWQKGTFRLYHHNPPLPKLVAALPVVIAGVETGPLYGMTSWTSDPPSQADFGFAFAFYNAPRYLELFAAARTVMPAFSVVGGLFVFAWSARLYGRAGGLLSLALWCLCPNILAHARLVTGDVAGASMAVAATYLFWSYLRRPTWGRAALAGVVLGLAELTKFSLLLLYGYWPLLWTVRIAIEREYSGGLRRLAREAGQGAAMVAISLVVIGAGYGFEGIGRPLGSFTFQSRTLTRPIVPTAEVAARPVGRNWIAELALRYRVNRFRGTFLGRVPAPLPYHFLTGFDEQRIETEGIPLVWRDPTARPDQVQGYPVYLDGTLRRTGWWYYYLACLAYKVPEGTWIVLAASAVALVSSRRGRGAWFDEFAVLAFPTIVLVAITAYTDINLGIRYVLPVFPFAFVAAGKVVPWAGSLVGRARTAATAVVWLALGLTATQTALIHPSYLASFNWASGGPDRGSEHLIDSNLDWGQDLVTLKRWMAANRPGRPVGLAYFGQVNPSLFLLRDEDFPWFLPASLPGTTFDVRGTGARRPAGSLRPGVYAVSASLVRGLAWRVYDVGDPSRTWSPSWDAREGAFGYYADLTPVAKVGHSIFVYDLSQADCDRINPRLLGQAGGPGATPANLRPE